MCEISACFSSCTGPDRVSHVDVFWACSVGHRRLALPFLLSLPYSLMPVYGAVLSLQLLPVPAAGGCRGVEDQAELLGVAPQRGECDQHAATAPLSGSCASRPRPFRPRPAPRPGVISALSCGLWFSSTTFNRLFLLLPNLYA